LLKQYCGWAACAEIGLITAVVAIPTAATTAVINANCIVLFITRYSLIVFKNVLGENKEYLTLGRKKMKIICIEVIFYFLQYLWRTMRLNATFNQYMISSTILENKPDSYAPIVYFE
jgi:hypothetical protein